MVVVPLVEPSFIVPLLDEFVPIVERRPDLLRFILLLPDELEPLSELVPMVEPLLVPLVDEVPF
ncbi:hypothetical protein SD10_01065 [Spirosoma radiotolerans]|uniref:Uncharacterized protein n=1 Tax=Spirosoma radiotolerans TaxID=1379870 RepID=A0A0E3ZT91_9BACT|nr:hypothetical protein SD10_01065 [Spirosoma radiotolerans]